MKTFMKLVAAIIITALCCNAKVYAADYHTLYESPVLDKNVDVVFSVAKDAVDDQTTNGNYYDPKPYGDYLQIHEDANGSGNNGRYTIHSVSGGAIAVGINAVLGEDARNINEDYLDNKDAVETVLRDYSGIDYEFANNLAIRYISANYSIESTLFRIDWAALKYQQEGRVHVDGRVVEVEPIIEEPVIEEPIIEEPIVVKPTVIPPVIVRTTPTPTPTEAPTPTPTPTPELTPEPIPTPEPTSEPTPTEEPTPIEVEEIEIEEVEIPEGAPEEEIELIIPEVPESVPIEEEDVDIIEIPQGAPEEVEEELPQTGIIDSAVFDGLGALLIALGIILIRKRR